MSTENKKLNRADQLVEKWSDLLTEGKAQVDIEKTRKNRLLSAIYESQEQDMIKNTSDYANQDLANAFGGFMTSLNEAVVDGDHGYDPSNIASGLNTGAAVQIAPAVLGIAKRSIPNSIVFDLAGVQPMSLPTGQFISIRSMYGKDPLDPNAKEAFHPMFAPDAMHSGQGAAQVFETAVSGKAFAEGDIFYFEHEETGSAHYQTVTALTMPTGTVDEVAKFIVEKQQEGVIVETAFGMATGFAELQEQFNGSTDNAWNEMSFRIDKTTVEAKSRQLKAQYSIELAQDLRAVHGMNADAELSTILATEITLEINREYIDWINYTAQVGKTGFTNRVGSQAGVFNFNDFNDIDGARWAGEKWKALIHQIGKEAMEIGRQTGRGEGNFIIASRNVVNVLRSTDQMVSPAAAGAGFSLNTDASKGTFAGILAGRYKVYIDQYARYDYFTVGYKGSNEMDAGIYYMPYVALTPLKGSDPKNFQPVMGFKTRYGIGINPFAESKLQRPKNRIGNGMPLLESVGKNAYFRRVTVVGC